MTLNQYMIFLNKYSRIIAITIPFIVFLLSLNLLSLTIDGSYRVWFEKDSKILLNYDLMREEFGNDIGVIVAFKDESGIFNKKPLKSIESLTKKLATIPYIEKVDSLVNYQHVHLSHLDEDNILVNNFIQNINSLSVKKLEELKKISLKTKGMLNSFISKDAKTTIIFAKLTPNANEGMDVSGVIMQKIMSLIREEHGKTGYSYWLNGGPVMTQAFINVAGRDATLLIPLSFLLVAALLAFLFKNISGVLMPICVVILTILMVFVIQLLFGFKLNNFTVNIPIFIMAIGIADSIHIFTIWIQERKSGLDNLNAVKKTLDKNFLPIFLTSLTTSIGFLTLYVSSIAPIKTLGLAIATGTLFAFMLSIIWIPAMLLTLNINIKQKTKNNLKYSNNSYGVFIVRYDKIIVFFFIFLVGVMSVGIPKLKIDSNLINLFDKEVEIRQSAEFIMENITGPMSYSIVLDSKKQDGVSEPNFLKNIERFYRDYQSAFPKDIRHIDSLLDIVKEYNILLNGQDQIPDDKDLVAQYLLLHEISSEQGVGLTGKVDFKRQKVLINVSTNIVNTSKDLEMINFVKKWWSNTGYSVDITGQTPMNAFLQKDVSKTLIYSFFLTLFFVSFVMLAVLKDIRKLWILLVPNIIPVVLIIGLLGWLEIPIDMGIAISGAIIIGLSVDDTIHFLLKYFDAQKRKRKLIDSFNEVYSYAGKAIIFTTFTLALSFSVFFLSVFTPNQNFAIVTISALIFALITDLLFLPALISSTTQIKKK